MFDSAKRSLALAFLAFWTGCIATVQARPAEPVFCMELTAPDFRCDADYIWLPGYWGYDGWGRQTWIPGRYTPRWPNVRDHRR